MEAKLKRKPTLKEVMVGYRQMAARIVRETGRLLRRW